jgi:hypothetical protein
MAKETGEECALLEECFPFREAVVTHTQTHTNTHTHTVRSISIHSLRSRSGINIIYHRCKEKNEKERTEVRETKRLFGSTGTKPVCKCHH